MKIRYVKKILLSILILMIVFLSFNNNVFANNKEVFSSITYDDFYIKKLHSNYSGKYKKLGKFIRNSDGRFVYCVQPWIDLVDGEEYDIITSNQESILNISSDTWKRITLIAYYGYGYKNHTDERWYGITQLMIWQTVDPTGHFYFTKTLNGDRDYSYDWMINEINGLINSYNVETNFNTTSINLNIGESTTLNDTNNVLDKYELEYDKELLSVSVNNNQMTITAKKEGNTKISLIERYENGLVDDESILYNHVSSQKLISRGKIDPTDVQLLVSITGGKINLIKHDIETKTCLSKGQASLVGAKYNIIDSNNNIVDTLTIGNDCSALSKILPYGNYKIIEIEASNGYTINPEITNITLNSSNQNVYVYEKVIEGRVNLSKVDSKTNICKTSGDGSKLEGAIYDLYDSNSKLVDSLIIGDDCTAISKLLPYGHYTLKERKAGQGYLLDTTIYDIVISNENEEIKIVSKEDIIENYVSILKQYGYVDENTTFLNGEKGITFEIYNSNNEKYKEIVTDIKGYANITLPYGKWRFHQVNTTEGYEKIHDFYITVNETSEKEQYYNILNNKLSAYLQVIKVDSETKKTIAIKDTTFKILNTDTNQFISQYIGGKYYDTFRTDSNGSMVTYLKLEAGNYKLIEVESPYGYLLNNTGLNFTIGKDTKYDYDDHGAIVKVYFENTPIKGQIEINKLGEKFTINDGTFSYEEVSLENVVFNIYAKEDIKTSDGKHLYYNKNDLVDVITTDKKGYAISKELPLGKYYFVEVKTNDNYILDKQEYNVELTEVDNKTAVVYKLHGILNKYEKGIIDFTKTDLVNGEVIPNTKIEIYNASTDELIYSGITNQDGKIIIKNLPVNNKFYVIESEPATGYVKTNEKVFFEIKSNGEIVKANMTNRPITGKLEFSKIDLSTSNPLPNTVIEIYDANTEELVFSGTTDDKGMVVIEELRYGKYYILEKEAPEGYILNTEKMYFEIKTDGEIVKSIMTNEKIIVEVPNTGLDNIDIFNVIGLSMIGIGVSYIVIYVKKRKK